MDKSPSRSSHSNQELWCRTSQSTDNKAEQLKSVDPSTALYPASSLSSKKLYYVFFDEGPKLCVPLFPQL